MGTEQRVKGVSKFREFKPGNIIKVITTDKRELKGIYVGQNLYKQGYKMAIHTGQYLVMYDVQNKTGTVINLIDYCLHNKTHIETVGAARLIKGLSDYLRKYYRDFTAYQELQKQAYELENKKATYLKKLNDTQLDGNKLDETVQRKLKEELFASDPITRIQDMLTTENTGFNVRYAGMGRDIFYLTYDYYRVHVSSSDVGARTYLEYDDTRMEDRPADPKKIVQCLQGYGYLGAKLEHFNTLAKKYKSIANIKGEFFSAYLRDGKGDRYAIECEFTIQFPNPKKVSEKQLKQLISDLYAINKEITRNSRVR